MIARRAPRAAGSALTALPVVARATIDALREHPALNARLDGDGLHAPRRACTSASRSSLGEDGLIVPGHPRRAGPQRRGARRARSATSRARARRRADARRGPRRHVHDHEPGPVGAIMATPVINQPQVAILDLEAVVKRPVVITDADGNDAIAIRPMTILGLSWDHRALDGAEAAQFLRRASSGGWRRCARGSRWTSPWTDLASSARLVEYGEALELQEPLRDARAGGRDPGHAAAARAPARLHARAAQRTRRAPAAARPGTASGASTIVDVDRGGKVTYHGARPARRLPDRGASSDVVEHVRSHGARDRRRPRRGGRRRARARDGGARYTGVWVGEAQDRLDRRARPPRDRDARARDQRRQRPRAVQWVVPCGLPGVPMTSVAEQSGRDRGAAALPAQAAGVAPGPGARHAPADRVARAGARHRCWRPPSERRRTGAPAILQQTVHR